MQQGEVSRHEITAAFSGVLRELREKRGLSQEKLAELSHMERNYVYYLEKGTRQPSLRSMVHLARALGVTLTDLANAVEDKLTNQEAKQSKRG